MENGTRKRISIRCSKDDTKYLVLTLSNLLKIDKKTARVIIKNSDSINLKINEVIENANTTPTI